MKTIIVILFLVFQTFVSGQKINVGQMEVSWNHDKNGKILFTATAPDDGWVALGFNDKNDIVNSNLVMVSVQGDIIHSEEFFVTGAGNPQPIDKIGSSTQHEVIGGSENGKRTTITFSMPTVKIDDKHFGLKKGESIWLICAFSMEDEFEHHSRMRKHIKITL